MAAGSATHRHSERPARARNSPVLDARLARRYECSRGTVAELERLARAVAGKFSRPDTLEPIARHWRAAGYDQLARWQTIDSGHSWVTF